ncbi:MAG TPA: hypothetical protein VFU49_15890 [Ktedonobacteraceae bacterium]|nr:hypothetical protein [Ktedonobacteraceae bacterium]
MGEESRSDQHHQFNKLTPLQLREQYRFNIADLAHKAKVAPRAVYFMLLGYAIERQEAEQVLATISTLTGQSYTLETVDVVLVPEQEGQDAPSDEESPHPPSD